MKKIVCLIILAVFMLSFNSCKKEKLLNTKETIVNFDVLKNSSSSEIEKEEYDKNLRKFAKALAKSLKHQDLRKKIKDEAMLKIDGDYDIIWKNFNYTKIKTEKGEINLTELIAENSDEKDKTKDKKIADIKNFGNNYKKLQIAVPVNCDKWEADIYEPLVTFLPADFEEDWEEVEAFDSNGKSYMISVQDEPDVAVIVVGLNERSDENGDIAASQFKVIDFIEYIEEEDEEYPPIAPSSFTSTSAVCYQIDLSWYYPSGTDVLEFNIYRKKYGEPYFVFLTTVPSYQKNYFDTNVDDYSMYYYYVTASNLNFESQPSNQTYAYTAQCPEPSDPVNLKINYLNTNLVNLTWSNVTNETGYQIWQRIWDNGVLNSWEQVGITGLNQTEFEISSFQYDKQYYYKVYAYNEEYTSAPSDNVIVYSTMRDITKSEIVGECYFFNWDALRLYESWLNGAPEMAVKVVTINNTSGTSIEIVGETGFEPYRDNDIVSPSKFVWDHSLFNWDIRIHPVVVTWVWYEKDSDDTELSITVGVSGEIPKTGIKINASATVKITAKDDLIYSQAVNWHDEVPKTYNNGYFYFQLKNE